MNVHEEIKRVEVLLEDAVLKESYVEAYGSLRMAVLTLAEIVEALHLDEGAIQQQKCQLAQGLIDDYGSLISPGNDG